MLFRSVAEAMIFFRKPAAEVSHKVEMLTRLSVIVKEVPDNEDTSLRPDDVEMSGFVGRTIETSDQTHDKERSEQAAAEARAMIDVSEHSPRETRSMASTGNHSSC